MNPRRRRRTKLAKSEQIKLDKYHILTMEADILTSGVGQVLKGPCSADSIQLCKNTLDVAKKKVELAQVAYDSIRWGKKK